MRRHRSIFIKLLGVFLVTGILLNMATFGFFRIARPDREEIKVRHAVEYLLESLVLRLGEPPRQEEAQKIAKSHGIRIAFTTQTRALYPISTAFNMISGNPFQDEEEFNEPGNRMEWHRGELIARLHRANGTYWIQYSFSEHDSAVAIFPLLLILSVIVAGGFFMLRWVLSPIGAMMKAVKETSDGNFAYRMDSHRRDEFGKLASMYNTMQSRVQELMEARRQLLLDVSHEIRTPLTRMKLSLEFMERNRYSRHMAEEISLMNAMLTEVLENERMNSLHESLQKTSMDLAGTIEEVVARFTISQQIEVSLERVSVAHDPVRMGLALQNLIENSIRHTDAEGRIINVTLSSGRVESKDFAILSVQDNGPGIALEQRERIFEPFYRRPESSGFGLGLSLVARIVEAHGGSIQLDPERSSRFVIRLPLQSTKSL